MDTIELKSAVARSNNEVDKLTEDMNNQCKYIASLEEELARASKKVKNQKEELKDLQVSFDELHGTVHQKKFAGITWYSDRLMDGYKIEMDG